MGNIKFYIHSVYTNYGASKNGDIKNLKKGNIINKNKNNYGYLYFTIYDKKLKKNINFLQHRFIYEVFNGLIPKNLEVDHINEIKTDNRIKNLQLLTHKENVQKSRNKQIISTCIKTGENRIFKSITSAAIKLNIWQSQISSICSNYNGFKSATSKKDGCVYTFKYY